MIEQLLRTDSTLEDPSILWEEQKLNMASKVKKKKVT